MGLVLPKNIPEKVQKKKLGRKKWSEFLPTCTYVCLNDALRDSIGIAGLAFQVFGTIMLQNGIHDPCNMVKPVNSRYAALILLQLGAYLIFFRSKENIWLTHVWDFLTDTVYTNGPLPEFYL